MFWSIIFFGAVICLLGRGTVLLATGKSRQNIETHVMASGVGLGAFAVVALLFNACGIPLAWWSFFFAGVALEALGVFRCQIAKKPAGETSSPEPFWTRDDIYLAVAGALAAATFALFLNGAFSAPWLDDDDSWEHASSAEYITLHRTYSVSPEVRADIVSYLEPYPPAYPALMGVTHQLNDSMSWTLKFFTVLLVALAVLYFYPMAKEITGKPATAIWMTGALWIMPCFMSHFTWAQTLAVALFFPAFYSMERARREGAWAVMFAVCFAGIALAQPSAAAIFGVMALLYWLVNLVFALTSKGSLFSRKVLFHQAAAAVAACAVAAAFYLPEYLKFGRNLFLYGIAKIPIPAAGSGTEVSLAKLGGTSHGTLYTLWDYVWAPVQNKINQPTGIGFVLFFVVCAGIALLIARPRLLKQDRWRLVALLWLVFTVLGVESNRFPITLFPHRFWVFLAIPAAMIAGEFFAWLASGLDRKNASLVAASGLALGLTLACAGVPQKLTLWAEHAEPSLAGELSGTTLFLLVASIVAAAGALGATLYRLAHSSASAGAWTACIVAPVLLAGVVVTSGYSKACLQGFIEWPPGVRFYREIAIAPDGRQTVDYPELRGYLDIHRGFAPNSRILCVNGPDDHLIGFDMLALPYDSRVLKMRKEILDSSPEKLDAQVLQNVIELARAKGFDYLLVDLYWAAEDQYNIGVFQGTTVAAGRHIGLSDERLQAILFAGAELTEREKASFGASCRLYRLFREKGAQDVARARRLRALMQASSELKPVLDTGPSGLAVFEIKPK